MCKDLRYPAEFFIDIIFDNDKNIQSNNFEEDVIKWKNIISDFIVKGYKSNLITSGSPDASDASLNKPVTLLNDIAKENKINNSGNVDLIVNDKIMKKESEINKAEKNIDKNYKSINDNFDYGKVKKRESADSKESKNLENNFEHEEEEGNHVTTNTLEQANEILQKFNQGKNQKNEDNDEEEEEEDLDDYIKNLENKA